VSEIYTERMKVRQARCLYGSKHRAQPLLGREVSELYWQACKYNAGNSDDVGDEPNKRVSDSSKRGITESVRVRGMSS
jgi:hypothetical protein